MKTVINIVLILFVLAIAGFVAMRFIRSKPTVDRFGITSPKILFVSHSPTRHLRRSGPII